MQNHHHGGLARLDNPPGRRAMGKGDGANSAQLNMAEASAKTARIRGQRAEAADRQHCRQGLPEAVRISREDLLCLHESQGAGERIRTQSHRLMQKVAQMINSRVGRWP
ncbi:MAG: hypothetical protein VKI83_10190, partial [Synechococcaceae cyanobacterium]|nr:hypothetical protein [Synechococcaceae cyanobacterium]